MKKAHPLVAGVAAATLLLAGCGDDDNDTGTSDTTEAPADASTTTGAAAGVAVTDVWARSTAPTAENGAVYLTLTAAADDALVGVAVDASIADTAEIHETVAAEDGDDGMGAMDGSSTTMADDGMGAMDGSSTTMADDGEGAMDGADMTDDTTDDTGTSGMEGMTMQPVEAIELPAGEAVTLEPGGYHIMLFGLAAPLEAGQTFELTLTFRESGEQTVSVEVRDM